MLRDLGQRRLRVRRDEPLCIDRVQAIHANHQHMMDFVLVRFGRRAQRQTGQCPRRSQTPQDASVFHVRSPFF